MEEGACFSAVIQVSADNEPYGDALASVTQHSKYFKDIHMVKPGYTSQESDSIKQVEWHNEPSLDALQTRVEVSIRPDIVTREGAWKALLEDITKYKTCTRFAVSSTLVVSDGFSLWNGFLILVNLWDTLRWIVNWGSYHRGSDLRVALVSITGPSRRSVLQVERNPIWFLWYLVADIFSVIFAACLRTKTCRVRVCQNACNQQPRQSGCRFVLRELRQHPHMGFGNFLWLLTFMSYWFYLFLPLWVYIGLGNLPLIGAWLPRNPLSLWVILPNIVNLIAAAWCSQGSINLGVWQSLYVLLLPVHVFLFPFVLFYARVFTGTRVEAIKLD